METNNSPVIFLDIDGVLNSSITHKYAPDSEKLFIGSDWVYVPMLQTFKNFVIGHNAKIVGVSSWFSTKQPQENVKIMEALGLAEYFIGTTDYTGGGMSRGSSVLRYVEQNQLTRWAVLDDAGASMYQFPTVIVNGRLGISKFDLDQLARQMKANIDLGMCKQLQNMGL